MSDSKQKGSASKAAKAPKIEEAAPVVEAAAAPVVEAAVAPKEPTVEEKAAKVLGTPLRVERVRVKDVFHFLANPRLSEELKFDDAVEMAARKNVASGGQAVRGVLEVRQRTRKDGSVYLRLIDGARRQTLALLSGEEWIDVVIYPDCEDADKKDKEFILISDHGKRPLSAWGRAVLLFGPKREGMLGEDLTGLVPLAKPFWTTERDAEAEVRNQIGMSKDMFDRSAKVWDLATRTGDSEAASRSTDFRLAIGGPMGIDPIPFGDYTRELFKKPVLGMLTSTQVDQYIKNPSENAIVWNQSNDSKGWIPAVKSKRALQNKKDGGTDSPTGKKLQTPATTATDKAAQTTATAQGPAAAPTTNVPKVTVKDIRDAQGFSGTIAELVDKLFAGSLVRDKQSMDLAATFTEALLNPATEYSSFRQKALRTIALGWVLAKHPESDLAKSVGTIFFTAYKRGAAEVAAAKIEKVMERLDEIEKTEGTK